MTDPKRLVTDFFADLWERRDLDAAERYLGPGFTDHTARTRAESTAAGLRQVTEELFRLAPDCRLDVRDVLADGQAVAVHWRLETTPPDTGRIVLNGIDLYRVQDGRITDRWEYDDGVRVLREQEGPQAGAAMDRGTRSATEEFFRRLIEPPPGKPGFLDRLLGRSSR